MKYHSFLYLTTAILVIASAKAEVYKCGNGGKAVYQQQPCENAPHRPPMKLKDISKERQVDAQRETKERLEMEKQRQKEKQAEQDKERALQIEEAKIKETRRQTNAIREQTEALKKAPISDTYTEPYWPFYGYPYGQRDMRRRGHDEWGGGRKQDYPHDYRDRREQPDMNEQWWMNPRHDMNDQWWMNPRHNSNDQRRMKKRR